jgi:peptidoglycan hydrolase CwlO-like protein
MKKTMTFLSVLSAIVISCGSPTLEETIETTTIEATENAKMDSIANELDQTAKEIDAAVKELDNIINEL